MGLRRPDEIPAIGLILAWIAYFAALLAGLSSAADAFAARQPPMPRRPDAWRDRSEADVIDADADAAEAVNEEPPRRGRAKS